jgi:hypothetical protein
MNDQLTEKTLEDKVELLERQVKALTSFVAEQFGGNLQWDPTFDWNAYSDDKLATTPLDDGALVWENGHDLESEAVPY